MKWARRPTRQILNLLRALQDEFNLTYVFISHDLSVMRQICTRIAVMYLGRIVELAESETIFEYPRHPYTALLISAVPGCPRTGRSANASLSAATSRRRSIHRAAACFTPGAHVSTKATAMWWSPSSHLRRAIRVTSRPVTTRSNTPARSNERRSPRSQDMPAGARRSLVRAIPARVT